VGRFICACTAQLHGRILLLTLGECLLVGVSVLEQGVGAFVCVPTRKRVRMFLCPTKH